MTSPEQVRTDRGRKPPVGSDTGYRLFLFVVTGVLALVIGGFFVSIVKSSIAGWDVAGLGLLYKSNWNFINNDFGALPLILGTLATTTIAVILAVPISVLAALGVSHMLPRRLQPLISSIVELLAIIPSVIYGLWGLFVFRLTMQSPIQPFLHSLTAGHWPFSGPEIGVSLLLGGTVLAIMIIPTVTSISRDVLAAVPHDLMEGGLSLGATKAQVMRKIALPTARRGIVGAAVLGTGRALGETIAMVFLLGDAGSLFPKSAFSPTQSLAAEIANELGTSSTATSFGILACLALILMVMVFGVNLVGRAIVARSEWMLQR